MHWGTVWQELEMVMSSKGKGKVRVETYGEREKEGEDVAPIGIGRAWHGSWAQSSILQWLKNQSLNH